MINNNSSALTDQIIQDLEKHIQSVEIDPHLLNTGEIISVGDGVAIIKGLSQARMGEMLDMGNGIYGLVLNLNKNSVGVVILGDYQHIKAGGEVRSTGKLLSIPVGNSLLGRVINPLGQVLDGHSDIKAEIFYPMEKIAPGIVDREPVSVPLLTGIKAIDSMIPIGRGQRELIIGDRGTGKTSIPATTIVNQKGKGVICIYVAIGLKAAFVAQAINLLDQNQAMDHTVVIVATASDSAVMQYLAPYAGCAIGEYFMDQGKDVLIIYDDLSKHAWAYREISLLLKRPTGREAYPGDVFYLHSRLLERACKLNSDLGGGSMTALSIIETQEGDVSAYIPTNVISITDGQIYLEPDLFNMDIRPAINVGLSVSRVGGAAQTKAMKQVAGKLRLDLAQYRELAAFSQFASDLDLNTRRQLDQGARMTEILKQGWDEPYDLGEQILVIWTATNGYINQVKIEQVKEWEEEFVTYIRLKEKQLIEELTKTKDKLTDKQIKAMQKVVEKFNITIGRKFINEAEVSNNINSIQKTDAG